MNRKELRQRNKWKRGLSKKLVESISEFNPKHVEFKIFKPNYVECIIETADGIGQGISICSFIDESVFDERKGRNIAAGRALKALKKKCTSEQIRNWDYDIFPRTWFIRQADKISEAASYYGHKSIFNSCYC